MAVQPSNDTGTWFIGPHEITGRALLAPMAGITDYPFRSLCLRFGAAMATAEMSSSKAELKDTLKSRMRLANLNDQEPRTVQIVGHCPMQMADAARYQVDHGAQIVDINMGCPAKKVCNKAAGSALLSDESLVEAIISRVVSSVDVPVTLKIRTGVAPNQLNALKIAKIAENNGIRSLAIHGRTRACRFKGEAEYDTIAKVAYAANIPVIANGDICTPAQAQAVLKKTGATAVMLGRAVRGNPWLFSEINALLNISQNSCALLPDKALNLHGDNKIEHIIIGHLRGIYHHYDRALDDMVELPTRRRKVSDESSPKLSVRVARKHICWYFEQLERMIRSMEGHSNDHYECGQDAPKKSDEKKNCSINRLSDRSSGTLETKEVFQSARRLFNQLQTQSSQLEFLENFFADLRTTGVIAA